MHVSVHWKDFAYEKKMSDTLISALATEGSWLRRSLWLFYPPTHLIIYHVKLASLMS